MKNGKLPAKGRSFLQAGVSLALEIIFYIRNNVVEGTHWVIVIDLRWQCVTSSMETYERTT